MGIAKDPGWQKVQNNKFGRFFLNSNLILASSYWLRLKRVEIQENLFFFGFFFMVFGIFFLLICNFCHKYFRRPKFSGASALNPIYPLG